MSDAAPISKIGCFDAVPVGDRQFVGRTVVSGMLVDIPVPAMEGHEQDTGTDAADPHRGGDGATRAGHLDDIAGVHAVPGGVGRIDLRPGLACRLLEFGRSSGIGLGVKVVDRAAGGQRERGSPHWGFQEVGGGARPAEHAPNQMDAVDLDAAAVAWWDW
ncbi:hypothetical protein GTC6_20240 [Gordonia terrae C-6]|uniref:Uncharacterized protein n=1 Tax=Gordonia terrae C-6 TaxID=1316928 RepID=R7Y4I1_9ACTN|nr:hypothetical protein GTC6_20240 [Gordonia terrae C-6]